MCTPSAGSTKATQAGEHVGGKANDNDPCDRIHTHTGAASTGLLYSQPTMLHERLEHSVSSDARGSYVSPVDVPASQNKFESSTTQPIFIP